MKRGPQGRFATISTVGEEVKAFFPAPLPPKPPLEWSAQLREKFDRALLALGQLDATAALLPDISILLSMSVRKEAVLSSRIEGTQSSLSDLLLYEIDGEPGVAVEDVREVSRYVAALEHGLRRLHDGFPLSLRLIKEIHEILMAGGRGTHQSPGEFRRSQNWIGGTRPGNAVFVPPPPEQILDCLGSLENFLHDDSIPALPRAALSHVQFETIHPFLDGNGRVGRLLITLLLSEGKILREPLLYLSLYFKNHRQIYYDLLNTVRLEGDWEAWLDFFADAVLATSSQAMETGRRLFELSQRDRSKISALGRATASAEEVHRALRIHPIATSGWLVKQTGLTPATVNKALERLVDLGILKELTGQKRNRVFGYVDYIAILNLEID